MLIEQGADCLIKDDLGIFYNIYNWILNYIIQWTFNKII